MTETTTHQDKTLLQQERYRYSEPDQEACNKLAHELGIPFPLAVLLWQRGLIDANTAEAFLTPQLASIPSPFLLQDMDKAVALVHEALQENWPIYIHGDYDVDGITASALLFRFFRQLGKKTVCYQPNRLKEGYGLQENFIRAKAPLQNKSALLITVDCGISDLEEIELAKELGFKVIITDHHLPGDTLPAADAVINPRRPDCTFPFASLAGVGVAFFLAYGIRNSLVEKGEIEKEKAPNLKKLMDLVALGTVADVMPLTDINRILVRAGLETMNQPDCIWALALQKSQNSSGGLLTTEDISFRLAPRINAPGRLGSPELAFSLLSSDSAEECHELATQIEELNKQRREHETDVLDQVLAACNLQHEAGAAAFVVNGSFHQGVIGIIASRVVDMFQKPVIIFTEDSSRLGTFKGSGRSIESINLHEVLSACTGSIIQFGGHAMAAGLAIHKDNLQFFTKQFESVVAGLDIKTNGPPVLSIDYCPEQEEVLEKNFLRLYQHMHPFGNGNPEPVFLLNNPSFIEPGVVKQNHLTFSLQSNGQIYRAIGFGMADKINLIRKGTPVQLAFKLKNTVYRGEQRVEVHVMDIQPTP